MARLTITLSDPRHRALKEAAARRGRSIGELIEDSLDFYGIKPGDSVEAIVERVRQASRLTEDEALQIATEETRAARGQ